MLNEGPGEEAEEMHFTKMHGIGNDYIYVDGSKEHLRNPSETAIRLSDRHFGIGSDGLILINPSETADFEMEMYNADGSRGKMCGNGIRCVGKYVYDRGLTSRKTIKVETLAGIRTLEIMTGGDGTAERIRVDMDAPALAPSDIPVDLSRIPAGTDRIVDYPYVISGREYRITCVSMGNPHCVVFCEEDIDGLDLPRIGPHFENDLLFPERVNTEFVNVISESEIRMRVWERGSGETLACGTGACAAAAASILCGKTGHRLTVALKGGDLQIEWNGNNGSVYMTGTASFVFEGDIDVQD